MVTDALPVVGQGWSFTRLPVLASVGAVNCFIGDLPVDLGCTVPARLSIFPGLITVSGLIQVPPSLGWLPRPAELAGLTTWSSVKKTVSQLPRPREVRGLTTDELVRYGLRGCGIAVNGRGEQLESGAV